MFCPFVGKKHAVFAKKGHLLPIFAYREFKPGISPEIKTA
jgi:hypothetical protein